MSDEPTRTERDEDTKADVKAIVIVFVTALLMSMVYVSGFTFDF